MFPSDETYSQINESLIVPNRLFSIRLRLFIFKYVCIGIDGCSAGFPSTGNDYFVLFRTTLLCVHFDIVVSLWFRCGLSKSAERKSAYILFQLVGVLFHVGIILMKKTFRKCHILCENKERKR